MTLYDELWALISRLNKAKISYALCGGLAMAAHGWPRATMDIDMLIEEKNLEPARKIARSLGFKHEPGHMVFCNGQINIRRLVKFDGEEIIPLDLLIVTLALQSVWKQRSELLLEHGKIWVVSTEGLKAMKKMRKSGQDQDDIRKLRGDI